MIEIKINPESIERHRASVKAFETMRIGDHRIPIVINPAMAAGAISIAAMSTVFREYYETYQRNDLALYNASIVTGMPPHEIRAQAARSLLPFDVYCSELIHDTLKADHPEAPADQRAHPAAGD